MSRDSLPVVIIGAGPVGLAAAAHALSRNLTPLVLEAGPSVGAGIRQWGHVRMFSPWKFNVDSAAAAILARQGWSMPNGERIPDGRTISSSAIWSRLSHASELRAAHPHSTRGSQASPGRVTI